MKVDDLSVSYLSSIRTRICIADPCYSHWTSHTHRRISAMTLGMGRPLGKPTVDFGSTGFQVSYRPHDP